MMANDLELRHTAIAGAGSAAFLKVEAMKLRLIEFVTFLTLLLSVGSSLGQTSEPVVVAVPSGPVAADIATLIEKSRVEWSVPGLSVAIVKDGQVFLSRGFGVREFGKTEVVDGDTLFAIASNSKAFTATAIAMLDEEGKLKWSDRVQQHLPWLELLICCVIAADLEHSAAICFGGVHRIRRKRFCEEHGICQRRGHFVLLMVIRI